MNLRQRINLFSAMWGVQLTPFLDHEIDATMTAPGGTYITAFCRNCRRRVRHKIWMKPITKWLYLRMAYCMLCRQSWRYTGYKLSNKRGLL